jgi:DNA-binding Lrp family transcriptional regulator
MMPTFKDFAKEVGAWSFVAAEATLQELVETLLVDKEVERHTAKVSLKKLSNSQDEDGNYVMLKPDPSSRTMLAVAIKKRRWSVVYRTLGYCEGSDWDWTRATAMRVAATLDCESIGSCCGDHGMATWLFDGGDLLNEFPPERPAVHKVFQARKILLPACFVGTTPAGLYADVGSLDEIEQADEIICRVA